MKRSCDTMVALGNSTRNGQTVFAKNSDRPDRECQPLVLRERAQHPDGTMASCQFVTLPEAAVTYRHIGSRPYWCWGYEHGFNEHQVVIGNEGLSSKLTFGEPKLVGMEALRLGLERGRTAAEAVEAITGLITRWGQGVFKGGPPAGSYDNGYLVADPFEAYVIETAGHEWAVEKVENMRGISNVYAVETGWSRLSPGADRRAAEGGEGRFNFAKAFSQENCRKEGVSSGARRRARSCAVLARHAGQIDAALMMALLSDHSDGTYPDEPFVTKIGYQGICFHSPEESGWCGNTAASLVADLCSDGSRLPVYWCSFYSPCLGIFFPVFIEGNPPAVLSAGGEDPDDRSPWWLFHRLSRAACAQPGKRVPAVRKRWARLQKEFMESAYIVAAEGQRLRAEGQVDSACSRVTQYMEECVGRVIREAQAMVGEFA
ncbi:MAG: hypothetical protein IT210_13945 [Armatimonadetes bacterium]|nr:hypothetical protein [Armatimonadota bacterium]